MKTIAKRLCLLLLLGAMLASCSTEQRALRQMRTLTYNIERHGDTYTNEDWKEAYDDYKKIDDKMDVKKLSSEEQREYGELQSRCLSEFAKCKVESVIDAVRAYINQGAGFLKGLLDLLR